jgi:ABC-type uncharacterized transport system substrate-binding protein
MFPMMNRLLMAGLALVCGASTAHSHPHVFVEMATTIALTDDGKIRGVKLNWAFDDAYAQVALEGMDANGDGTYSPEELSQLTKENLESIADYGYFTVMRQSNKKLEIAGPGASTQTYTDQKLRLEYELLLKEPVDPKAGEFEVKIYDSEFYIAFDYTKINPVTVAGNLPQGCVTELKPLPTGEELEAKREFLASKPVDWKPEPGEEEDFGAVFAQALVLKCG